ncbi:hypothetical protein BDY19DRAFT_904340 [Irpex rosettiformis]|uniref:Uncharacterized protein n=1 Tax=Irpex rosettiformis TaxID=378272 RepID=A0ACB8UBK1_9APHY|nr:hypothetical protein BDY19DRAFT_904340 [Irpex rosettiformis]
MANGLVRRGTKAGFKLQLEELFQSALAEPMDITKATGMEAKSELQPLIFNASKEWTDSARSPFDSLALTRFDMSSTYPQVGANAFAQGCEVSRSAITDFYTALNARLGLNPDERGLTDQLLYHLTGRVPVNVSRSSVDVEATKGYDYSWQFSAKNPITGMWQKRWLFFQAKNYKPTTFSGQHIRVADFAYKNNNGLQMELLNTHITQVATANPDVIVTGGYLCYATDTVQFIPIGDVRARYNYDITHGITTKDAINRDLSKTFLTTGEAHYNIQNILTYGST